MFQKLRSVKDAYEIDCVERAQQIAEAAFAQLLPRITYTATEMELAAELEYLMKKNSVKTLFGMPDSQKHAVGKRLFNL